MTMTKKKVPTRLFFLFCNYFEIMNHTFITCLALRQIIIECHWGTRWVVMWGEAKILHNDYSNTYRNVRNKLEIALA